MTLVTLVSGGTASVREQVIGDLLDPGCSTALILEGLPDGSDRLSRFTDISHFRFFRIAPGCVCCVGNLTLRVTLNRILRHPPARIYLSLATTAHLHEVRQFLTAAPYDQYLQLTQDMHV